MGINRERMNIYTATKIHYKNQLKLYLNHICIEILDNYCNSAIQICINEIQKCFESILQNKFSSKSSNIEHENHKEVLKRCINSFVHYIPTNKLQCVLDAILTITKGDYYHHPDTFLEFNEVLYRDIISSYIYADVFYSMYNAAKNMINLQNCMRSNNVKDREYIHALTAELDEKLKKDYCLLLQLYVYILNLYDRNNFYVLPQIARIKEKHDDKVDHKIQFLLSVIRKRKTGGNATDDKVETIKDMINDMSKTKAIIRNVYDIDDIKRIESLLQNSRINDLIQSKKLKLNPNFQSLLQDVSKDLIDDYEIQKNDEDASAFDVEPNKDGEKFKDFFDNFFIFSGEEQDEKEKLYHAFVNSPDKKVFIDYFLDRIGHNSFLNPQDKSFKVLSIADSLFSKILKSDLSNNSFNLNNNDTQFILMLETLESFKTAMKANETNHITININKDVNDLKVNNDNVSMF